LMSAFKAKQTVALCSTQSSKRTSRNLRRVRMRDIQLSGAKVSNPKFRGEKRKFPRHFKGHFSIGNMQVRILPGQPGSHSTQDSTVENGKVPAKCGLLQVCALSLYSKIQQSVSEIGESLWRILEIFPFCRDASRRRRAISTAWCRTQSFLKETALTKPRIFTIVEFRKVGRSRFLAPYLRASPPRMISEVRVALTEVPVNRGFRGAVRNVVGIRCDALSGNMKISFQAARSIG
jgi:hypothetical protein